MRTLFVVAPFAALGLLLSSCVPKSVHPLAAQETAKIDRQLVGDWYDQDDGTSFHITAKDTHWMHVVVTPKPSETKDRPEAPEEYDMFATDIGAHHFLNIVDAEKDNGALVKNYVFMRYALSSDHLLHLWSLSQDASAAAIRAGKLTGTVHQNSDGLTTGTPPHPDVDVTIEDSSANIASYIQSNGANGLFSEKVSTLIPGKPLGN